MIHSVPEADATENADLARVRSRVVVALAEPTAPAPGLCAYSTGAVRRPSPATSNLEFRDSAGTIR
jgi:hypothetical protein